jgi:2-polyprenyl-3-methyl-5-hydroxy-6-metoxy-1,4-benzoquinol methylase
MIQKEKADERFIPREFCIPIDPFIRHFERYFQCVKILKRFGAKEKWLDCACGSGYGTNFLTNFAEFVIGYDIDKGAIEYGNKNYKNSHCAFVSDIQHYNDEFDVVISVETIEHMPKEDAKVFLETLKTALKVGGTLVITTPIVLETNENPVNKFHYIEYSHNDFMNLLLSSGLKVESHHMVKTLFTDGEMKDQGYYKCQV